MSDAYIVGADMIAFGRYPDRTYYELGAEATLLALDDAGLSIKDVGAVYASSCFNAMSMLGQKVLKEIGQTGVPCINVSNACASGATAVREAAMAVHMSKAFAAALVERLSRRRRWLAAPAPAGRHRNLSAPARAASSTAGRWFTAAIPVLLRLSCQPLSISMMG